MKRLIRGPRLGLRSAARPAARPVTQPKKSRPALALEIQIHPSDIRRGVKYLFLSRRQILIVAASVLGYLSLVGFAAYVTPQVVGDMLHYPEYQALLDEREALGKRLKPTVSELHTLSEGTQEVRLALDRIYLAYGLEGDETRGQGGYPLVPRQAPESIFKKIVQEGFNVETSIREQQQVLAVFLDEVQEFESLRRTQMLTTPSVCPLQGEQFVLTSPFGNRRSPFTNAMDFHAGVDLAAPEGLPIHAPADGQVVFAGRIPERSSVAWWRYGNLVVVKHNDDFISLYAHCHEVRVRKGQRVRRGDVMATVGNTGFSTNPHLHYEIRRRDPEGKLVPVDPRVYMFDLELSDQERILVAARSAPSLEDYEPLPRLLAR